MEFNITHQIYLLQSNFVRKTKFHFLDSCREENLGDKMIPTLIQEDRSIP